jgi:hypothetical protein
MFEQTKTFHALDRVASVIGLILFAEYKFIYQLLQNLEITKLQ